MLSIEDKLALLESYLDEFSDDEFAERMDSYNRIGPSVVEYSSYSKSPIYTLSYWDGFLENESVFDILNHHIFALDNCNSFNSNKHKKLHINKALTICANDSVYGSSDESSLEYCDAA